MGTWLHQLEREFVRWEHTTSKHWEESIIAVNYLRWAHQQTIYQEMAGSHMQRLKAMYGFESHRIHKTAAAIHP